MRRYYQAKYPLIGDPGQCLDADGNDLRKGKVYKYTNSQGRLAGLTDDDGGRFAAFVVGDGYNLKQNYTYTVDGVPVYATTSDFKLLKLIKED